MPEVFPFKALLPAPGLEMEVSANTHVDTPEEQLQIVRSNPNTYLQVVKPHLIFNEPRDPEKHYPHARKAIEKLIADGVMVQDSEDSLYVYCQVNLKNDERYYGSVCYVSARDYFEGRIKVHENTLTEKENQLIDHIRSTRAIGEPVLLTHFEDTNVETLLAETFNSQAPDIDFTDEVNRRHMIYKVKDHARIAAFCDAYRQLSDFYIADGHHRSAASADFYKMEGNNDGHYLAFVVPANHLHIDSFYRAYKAAGTYDETSFINRLKDNFEVQGTDKPVVPDKTRKFGLYTSKGWYRVNFRKELPGANAVEDLDVSILEKYVFKGMLNIDDSKTDKQLTYIKSNIHIADMKARVVSGEFDLFFTVYPCDIEQVFRIADQGLIMPPKSTYIEPKLRTGLTVQLV